MQNDRKKFRRLVVKKATSRGLRRGLAAVADPGPRRIRVSEFLLTGGAGFVQDRANLAADSRKAVSQFFAGSK